MFNVTVEGQYFSGTKNNKIPRPYGPEVFTVKNMVNALHVVQRQLLDERLRRKYRDYAGWRTCAIISSKPAGEAGEAGEADNARPISQIPIKEMSLDQLQRFVVEKELPVNVAKFGSVASARIAVSDAFDDKCLVERQQAEEAAKKAAKEKEAKEIQDLNAPEQQPTGPNDLEDLDPVTDGAKAAGQDNDGLAGLE